MLRPKGYRTRYFSIIGVTPTTLKLPAPRLFSASFPRSRRSRCLHRSLLDSKKLLEKSRPYGPEILRNALLFLEQTVELTFVVALAYALPFIILLFSTAHAYLHLGKATVVDEYFQRYDGIARVVRLFLKLGYFLTVEQQLAVASGHMVVVRTVEIFRYVHTLDPYLSFFYQAVGVDKRCLAFAYRLYLGTREHDSRRICVGDFIIEPRLLIPYVDILGFHFNCKNNENYRDCCIERALWGLEYGAEKLCGGFRVGGDFKQFFFAGEKTGQCRVEALHVGSPAILPTVGLA